MRRFFYQTMTQWVVIAMAVAPLSGCMSAYEKSIGGDTEQIFSRYYLSDFNTVWQSVLGALKSIPLDIANRESGFLRTKWTLNTADKNFFDSFGPGGVYLQAQYRIRISLSKGFYNGTPSVKVSVLKEQMIQRDVLEGWRPVVTDTVDEHTLLYRVGRLVYLQTKIAEVDKEKTERVLRESTSTL